MDIPRGSCRPWPPGKNDTASGSVFRTFVDALRRMPLEIRGWLELDSWQRESRELGRRERESDLVKLGGFRVQIERWPEWPGKNPAG